MLKRLSAFWTIGVLALTVAVSTAQPVDAQGFLSLINPLLADSTEEANESPAPSDAGRVRGIVLDADGNVAREEGFNASVGASMPMPMGTNTLMSAQSEATRFRAALLERLEILPAAFNEVRYILRASSPTGEISVFWWVLRASLILFLIGWLFERFVFEPFFGRRFITPLIKESPIGYSDKLPYLMIRFFFGIMGILVSMAVAYALGLLFYGSLEDTATSFTALAINVAYFSARSVSLYWRMILAPFLGQYRIPPFSDSDSKKLFLWLSIVAALDIFALVFTIWIAELGLNYNVYALFSAGVGMLMAVGHTLIILANKRAISAAIRGGLEAFDVSFMLRLFSMAWAPLLIFYIIVSWFGLVFQLVLEKPTSIPPIVAAYAVLHSMIVIFGFLNFGIERFFRRSRIMREMRAAQFTSQASDDEPSTSTGQARPAQAAATPDQSVEQSSLETEQTALDAYWSSESGDDGDDDGGHQAMLPPVNKPEATGEYYSIEKRQSIHTFEDLAHRVAGILTLGIGVIVASSIWGANALFFEGALMERFLDVLIIIFIGYVAYHAFRVWMDGKILEETGGEMMDDVSLGDEGAGASASRLATLLPLFRNTALVIIVIAVLLVGLLEIGINVSPLFAGAGVVGIAVGFGAQSLVRDIFSGAFFLFDDAFRKGEYIDIGGVKGVVERISVRSFQLRHHLGMLHTIPFGEIQFLTNYSRDWVIMKLPLRVTYDTDVEQVRKLVKKLGVELLDDPVIGHNFIQPLKSQGVIEMQDSAMIIRVKFMTKPGDQWLVRKRVFQDIRELFEREGIKFAHREVTVRLADGAKAEDLSEAEKQAVSAAARSAIEDEVPAEGPKDDR